MTYGSTIASGEAESGTPARNHGETGGSAAGGVRLLLRAEGLALTCAAAGAYAHAGFSWVAFAALFFAPDLTFAAYFLGPRWGAAAYNAVHATIGPLAVGAAGLAIGAPWLQAIALIGLAHVGFDRALGYGLKYSVGFGVTHLGRIGSAR